MPLSPPQNARKTFVINNENILAKIKLGLSFFITEKLNDFDSNTYNLLVI